MGRVLLLPSFSRNNINRILKTTLTKIGLPDGAIYTSKAFRRGATQELLQTRNTLEAIRGAGGWWVSGFRSYVDLEMGNDFRISMAPIVLSDGSSSEDEQKTKQGRQRRETWRNSQLLKGGTSSPPQIHRLPQGGPEVSVGFIYHRVFRDPLLPY